MKVFKVFMVACAAWLSLSVASQASIIVSVDMDLATDGIQTTNTIKVGDSFTAGLFMQTTAPTTLGNYNYSVGFTVPALSMTGRTETAFGSLNPIDNTNPIDNAAGRAFRFDGADFGAGQLTPLGPVQIGTVTFTAVAETGNAAITPGRFQPSFDLFFAADGTTDLSAGVIFNGGTLSITAVPEPSAIALMGVGVVGLAMGRRWTKRRSAKKLGQKA